jgi:tRNA nucleotidyltransferase (CCA-adding enzyme)
MIARSTTDTIDVAEIVSHFGGGGHERAAASLIRDRDLEEVRSELTRILPEHVTPSIIVAQIMSRGPQLLKPATTVEQAALMMSRFGHEGYPVVEDGKVIGLLTRRAVDRAIAHRLHTTAASLMEVGDYRVHPDDSIEFVQKLVAETGWGQVPVVDPGSGEIVGIVTRTDLLKILTSADKLPGRLNLSEKLEKALPEERMLLIKRVAQVAHERHEALYIVGGFVRDLILERPSLDFDLVVEGEAIALARSLARRFGGRVTSHARFGTAKWHLPLTDKSKPTIGTGDDNLKAIDLVSARTEFYTHPTALPTVERGSIKLDLHRRDFTINTLALRLDGRHYGDLHDYWGGLQDIQQGVVRVLHSLSFIDDPTRILRAVRFEQRFDFEIEERTLQLLLEARSLIDKLSGDRIRHELNIIIDDQSLIKILSRLNELGLLSAVHLDLVWDAWLKENLEFLEKEQHLPDWGNFNGEVAERKIDIVYLLWLLRLPRDSALSVAKRLKLPVRLSREIRYACQIWENRSWLASARPSEIFEYLEDLPPVSIYVNYLASDDRALKFILFRYAEQWRHITPITNGDELRRRGIPPGPIYRDLLRDIRSAWLDGQVKSPDDEENLLNQLLRRYDNPLLSH